MSKPAGIDIQKAQRLSQSLLQMRGQEPPPASAPSRAATTSPTRNRERKKLVPATSGPRSAGAALGKAAAGWFEGDIESPSEGASPSRANFDSMPEVPSESRGIESTGMLSPTFTILPESPQSYSSPSPQRTLRAQSADMFQQSMHGQDRAQWWLSEARRMRDEALRMRNERDRLRAAVEEAHIECRRLNMQNTELQQQLKHTQHALRDSKSMADAARRELEKLRQWIGEAQSESRRLSIEVQESDWKLTEVRTMLEASEQSCQQLKETNEDLANEHSAMREKVIMFESMGDLKSQSERLDKMQKEKQEAREEAKRTAKERDDARQELELLRSSVASKSQKRSSLKGANSQERIPTSPRETLNTRSSHSAPLNIQGSRSPRQMIPSPRKEPSETASHRAMAEAQSAPNLKKGSLAKGLPIPPVRMDEMGGDL